MVRVALATLGGIIAAVIAAAVEDSLGTPTFVQLLAMVGAIALILLLTAARRRQRGDDPAELLQQLDHHRRELYRLQARYQRKGLLTAAEISAWFRNKRTLAGLKKQLQKAATPYPPDAIDTAPPPAPVGLFKRTREFFRQPAVSLFIVLFLVSLALAYPLSAAAQFVFRDYLVTAGPFIQTREPDSTPVAVGMTATNTRQPVTNTPSPTEAESASSSTPTATTTATTIPTTQPTTVTVTAIASATSTNTAAPTATATATVTETPAPSATATDTATPTITLSPPGTPAPTLPPAPTATATFLPVGTLPPECDEGTEEAEPNNTFETAQGPLALGTTLCGYLDDVYDFYYVEVAAPGRLIVTLQNVEIEPGTPPLNLLKLFTAGTAPMEWCCFGRRDRIELTVAVNFGRYYILVDAREIVGLPYVLMVAYEAITP